MLYPEVLSFDLDWVIAAFWLIGEATKSLIQIYYGWDSKAQATKRSESERPVKPKAKPAEQISKEKEAGFPVEVVPVAKGNGKKTTKKTKTKQKAKKMEILVKFS